MVWSIFACETIRSAITLCNDKTVKVVEVRVGRKQIGEPDI